MARGRTTFGRLARRLGTALLLAPVVSLVAFAFGQPHAARSHLLAFAPLAALTDFEPIGRGRFVDPDWDGKTVGDFERMLAEAQGRVEGFFGSPLRSRPTVIAADSPQRIQRYMTNFHGSTHTTAVATIVVLGPKGRASVDVIAHELAHAEHAARAGWLRYALSPMWFIEGLGMQVDYRKNYADRAWAERTVNGASAPTLETLASGRGFAQGDLTANYAHARREVARWLSAAEPGDLAELLETWRFEQRYRAQ